jgi:DHA1 family bicyclomycin/chloramphenicol resistance-like MFS transporter
MGFASISTDLYLPAMPAIEHSLRAQPGSIELTISGYLIGFSLGQLFWGPIGDRHGRRVPIAIGLVLFVLGSAGCALSTTASMMVAFRIVQALGACAGVVIARAMVRDLYKGARGAQMLSTLMSIMAIAPLIGPLVGAQILALAGWRAIFWTLVGELFTLTLVMLLPETLPPNRRNPQELWRAMTQYPQLLAHRRVIGFASAGAFFYGGIFAYVAGTPLAYIRFHHVRAEAYGALFAAGVIGIMATNMLNARLVARFGIVWMLRAGTAAAALAGIATAITATTGHGGLVGLALPLFAFVSAAGFIFANSITGAMASFPERAGAVSALVGAVQYGTGILGSALVGVFADGTPAPLGWVVALAGVASTLSAWCLLGCTDADTSTWGHEQARRRDRRDGESSA